MNKEWAHRWVKGFQTSAEEQVEFYADEFHFEEIPLGISIRNDKEELLRCFAPFANKDPNNGLGMHNFTALDYIGNEHSGFTLWLWEATDCTEFLGVPTKGRCLKTRGITGHVFNKDGKLVRDMSWWDAPSILMDLDYPLKRPQYWKLGWVPGVDDGPTTPTFLPFGTPR